MTTPGLPNLTRPDMYVLVGLPASGKSTFARTYFPRTAIVSLDQLRGAVGGYPNNQDATADAVDVMHRILAARAGRHLRTVVDATHLHRVHRTPILDIADAAGMETVALIMPVIGADERNAERPGPTRDAAYGRRVPPDVFDAMRDAFDTTFAQITDEGFSRVHLIPGGWHTERRATRAR